MSKPKFIHLNVRSTFSLLEGMPSVKKIAARVKQLGMPAVAVTDINNMFGAVEVSKHIPAEGIQPILGMTIGLRREDVDPLSTTKPAPDTLTLLVQNEQGWKNIIDLASKAYVETPDDEPSQISMAQLAEKHEGLIALTSDARTGRPARLIREEKIGQAEKFLKELSDLMPGRVYVEIQRHGMHEEKLTEADLVDLAYQLDLPLVATNDCRFLTRDQAKAHEVLMCIGAGVTIADPSRPQLTEEHYIKSVDEMVELFNDIPEAIENSVVIAQRCAYKVPMGINYMPEWEPENDDRPVPEILRAESEEGLTDRLEKFVYTDEMSADEKAEILKTYQDRLDYELGIIGRMGFDGYFLIVSDFCKWSKENGIDVGPGRGSGACSLVAYVLSITNVDPIKYDLLFERFLNPDRVSLPDFDIDFCQERREQTIDYVRRKYGDHRVSQIITFGTLKARACIRDVGRVLQMPFGQVSQIAAFVPEGPKATSIKQTMEDDERLEDLYNTDDDVKVLLDIAMQIEGSLRHCSTHAAGVIIAPSAISTICPLYRDPRSPLPATQFSMGDAEATGLVKFDFLVLKTLTVVRKSVENVKKTVGLDLDPDLFPLDDPKSFELVQTGHTVGVFQIEGSGMQSLMRDAKPSRFEDLVALIALYRPGPMENIPSFIARKHGEEEIESIHESFDDFLTETYGIIVYQEQVMQCAQKFAGYTLGGADILRRAMGKKKQEEMDKQRAIFTEGAVKTNGVTEDFANKIFDTIDKFAGYGFNKSHALAYALVSFHTLYLKAHHPKEFMAASMTLDSGNTEKLFKFKQDLDRMEIELLPPDVNTSCIDFTVEGEAIRFALGAIKGAGSEAMKFVQDEREANGPYKDLLDFMSRMEPKYFNRRQLEAMAKAGAFDELEPNRHKVLKNVNVLLGYMQACYEDRSSDQIGLFGGPDDGGSTLEPPALMNAPAFDQLEELANELQAIGFYISAHPMDAFKEELANQRGLSQTIDLPGLALGGTKEATIACIVLAKREMRTKSGKRMAILTLSDSAGYQEAVLFPEAYERLALMLDEEGPFVVSMKMEFNNDELRLMIESMGKLDRGLNHDQALRIEVMNPDAIDHLKSVFEGQDEGGRSQVELVVPANGLGKVVLKLANKYNINRQMRLKMEALEGIEIMTIQAKQELIARAS
ncbi:MAG: DNA polymerase III subunit alpha [Magnetococcales bacterium]|nr:DNA polymerase III subunit alpha [Magnetococcales bacterium]